MGIFVDITNSVLYKAPQNDRTQWKCDAALIVNASACISDASQKAICHISPHATVIPIHSGPISVYNTTINTLFSICAFRPSHTPTEIEKGQNETLRLVSDRNISPAM